MTEAPGAARRSNAGNCTRRAERSDSRKLIIQDKQPIHYMITNLAPGRTFLTNAPSRRGSARQMADLTSPLTLAFVADSNSLAAAHHAISALLSPALLRRSSCEERADRVVLQPAGRRFLHRRRGHELLGGGLELAFASVAAVPEPDGSTPPMVWEAATLADPAERRGLRLRNRDPRTAPSAALS